MTPAGQPEPDWGQGRNPVCRRPVDPSEKTLSQGDQVREDFATEITEDTRLDRRRVLPQNIDQLVEHGFIQ